MSAVIFGLFLILLGVLQIRYPARIIESRRGIWRRQEPRFSRPERFGCFNLSISLLMILVGVLMVWWGFAGGRIQA